LSTIKIFHDGEVYFSGYAFGKVPNAIFAWIEKFMPEALPCFLEHAEAVTLPRSAKRLTYGVRIALSAAFKALYLAGLERPDAIISGTGLGCIEDSEKFLTALAAEDALLLPPAAFIHSIHNTIAAQIAMLLNVQGYNITWSQRSASFAGALLDALLLLQEKEARHVLVGGSDEVTEKEVLFSGEGAAWFVVSSVPPESGKPVLKAVGLPLIQVIPSETWNSEEASKKLFSDGIAAFQLNPHTLTYFLADAPPEEKETAQKLDWIHANLFSNAKRVYYKKFFGEYQTVDAAGLALALLLLTHTEGKASALIFNSYRKTTGTWYLVEKCEN